MAGPSCRRSSDPEGYSIKTLVLPVETLVREFDGKLLLALTARERGWNVIIGERSRICRYLSNLPPSIFLSKSARAGNAALFERLHSSGHRIAVLDEEALIRQSDEIYLMKHEKSALRCVSALMTWGGDNSNLWQRSQRFDENRIFNTGNPRMDLLRPEIRAFYQPQVDSIRERIGDYVLFNTNFAIVNHFVRGETRFKLASWVASQERERHESALTAHKLAVFDRCRAMVPKIAKALAPTRLVIRPHPSENPAAWVEAARERDNVKVLYEGSVVPWLAGALALVHNGCTSAVEAAILGTPVLSYRPLRCPDLESPLLCQLGRECSDDDALVSELARVRRGYPAALSAEQSKLLHHYVTGITGKLSSDNIVDVIDSVDLSSDGRSWRRRIAAETRRLLERGSERFGIATPAARLRMSYRAHKFPGLTEQLVNQQIGRFAKVLGRFHSARARKVQNDIFLIA